MLKALVGITLCLAALVIFMLTPTKADPLQPGTAAPAMESVDQNGKAFSLAEAYKKGLTLVYFYPKADTPVCTKQACQLQERLEDLQKKGIQIIGVSTDKPEAQKAFADKYKLTFTLLADSDAKVVKAFGVPMVRIGLATRQSFLVKDGKIVWHEPKVDPATHVDKVLEAVAALDKK